MRVGGLGEAMEARPLASPSGGTVGAETLRRWATEIVPAVRETTAAA
jgi:hypothetical protein